MNARFWIWHNDGWIKLTLKPGQSLSFSYGGPCEEGYSYSYQQYEHDGAGVVSQWRNEASDCDGRLDSYGASYCPLSQLRARDLYAELLSPDCEGIMAPEWERIEAGRRDYAAEAMGY